MSPRSRPAFLGILLVLALSVGVFASSSLALQDVSVAQEELLGEEVRPFSLLRTSGGVKANNPAEPAVYRMSFRAVLGVGEGEELVPDQRMGDVIFEQTMEYPVLSDPQSFVGPVGLPFASEHLGIQVIIPGDCFVLDDRKVFRVADRRCGKGVLTLGGQAFDVTELLRKVDVRLRALNEQGTKWVLWAEASFNQPGYGFPIATLGGGGSTLIIGDFGGTTLLRSINFSG